MIISPPSSFQRRSSRMPKAYAVVTYRSISDPEKLAAYAKLAVRRSLPFGARILARGDAVVAREQGLKQRTVVVEYPSLEKATAAYDSRRIRGGLKGTRRRRRARCSDRRGIRIKQNAQADRRRSPLRRARTCNLFSLSVLASETALGRTGFTRGCARSMPFLPFRPSTQRRH